MINLSNLSNSTRPSKKVQRIGRGPGSNRGKTCGHGHKGDKSRQGYKRHYGREGGQKPLFSKLPIRGFNHGLFERNDFIITFNMINKIYSDGEVVSKETLYQKGQIPKVQLGNLKVLATGKLLKKVTIEAHAFSKEAKKQLEENSVSFKLL